jgi:hypothetical protein
VAAVLRLLETMFSFWEEAPRKVTAPVMVVVVEAGKVTVRAVVHSRSRAPKVLAPVMVRAAEPVEVWRRVG